MPKASTTPLTKGEFDEWAVATKETLNSIEQKLEPLERIATSLKRIEENTAAMLRLYDRLDHRDHVFASKLDVDLKRIDADL